MTGGTCRSSSSSSLVYSRPERGRVGDEFSFLLFWVGSHITQPCPCSGPLNLGYITGGNSLSGTDWRYSGHTTNTTARAGLQCSWIGGDIDRMGFAFEIEIPAWEREEGRIWFITLRLVALIIASVCFYRAGTEIMPR